MSSSDKKALKKKESKITLKHHKKHQDDSQSIMSGKSSPVRFEKK